MLAFAEGRFHDVVCMGVHSISTTGSRFSLETWVNFHCKEKHSLYGARGGCAYM